MALEVAKLRIEVDALIAANPPKELAHRKKPTSLFIELRVRWGATKISDGGPPIKRGFYPHI